MLKLNRNTSTTIYATFSEKMINVEHDILLELTNEANPQQKFATILVDNISEYFPRIDKYNITVTDELDENAIQQITLPYNGFYEYKAFELEFNDESGDSGYDESDEPPFNVNYFEQLQPFIVKLIEVGRCKVDGEFSENVHPVYK